MKPVIKVCGMRDHENIHELEILDVDYVGFIFYPPSPRYVGHDFEMPKTSDKMKAVGVFVNEKVEKVLDRVREHNLFAIQLHGDESVEYILQIRGNNKDVQVFKAFGIKDKSDLEKLKEYEEHCDLFILDSKGKNYGGNGHTWDHSLLQELSLNSAFLLSGGIDETFDLANFSDLHPACIGVDLNSKFELEPGLKNISKLKAFVL